MKRVLLFMALAAMMPLLPAVYTGPAHAAAKGSANAPAAKMADSWRMDEYLGFFSIDLYMLNPFGPRDETAAFLKILTPYLQALTGQATRVEDVPGRAGEDAWARLNELPPDGHKLALVVLPNLIFRSMSSSTLYSLEDVAPEFILADAPAVLWVPASSPWQTLEDFLREARAKPESLIIAGGGSASATQMASKGFDRATGVTTRYIGYMGTEDAMRAASAQLAHAAWGYPLPELGTAMKMRPLAVAAHTRAPNMPALPTFDESGYDFISGCSFGLALPRACTEKQRGPWREIFDLLQKNPEYEAALISAGFIPNPVSPDKMANYMSTVGVEYRMYAKEFKLVQ